MYNLILWHLNSLMGVYLKSTQTMTAQVEGFSQNERTQCTLLPPPPACYFLDLLLCSERIQFAHCCLKAKRDT